MSGTTSTRLPYRARAVFGGEVVAESDAAIRIDAPDAAPQLWFPASDVNGAASGGSVTARRGEGDLADHVTFDDEEVLLEIIDAEAGDHERDITTKHFPNWGDAADLIDLMNVQADGDASFLSRFRSDWRRPVVEGSQILGQTIVAASRHTPDRRVVSASMIFSRAADARASFAIGIDEVSGGRTFAAVRTEATQGGRVCALGTVLLDVTADDVIRHTEAGPDVPGPYESTPCDMSVTGRDVRVVDNAYTGDPDAPVGPPELDAWVRFRHVPEDQAIHAGLLAQFTGHMSVAAALRPHAGVGQDQAHRTLSTAINAITISFHARVRADKWMLYHHRSTHAGDGMTHSECRVYDEDRALVASFTVEAMVRAFADPTRSVDDRTAM